MSDLSRSDLKMMTTAINQRWNIKPEWRDAMLQRVMRMIVEPSSSNRDVRQAFKLMLQAEAQNQSDERDESAINVEGSSVLEVAAKLGLASTVTAIPEATTGSDTEADG